MGETKSAKCVASSQDANQLNRTASSPHHAPPLDKVALVGGWIGSQSIAFSPPPHNSCLLTEQGPADNATRGSEVCKEQVIKKMKNE
uniref:Uncharacterized protein n=1 Tax=Echinococcus granulosus TaxID=6210 RepID=A0A068WRT5_ECHGR|nr:hypothetical protein EgrG_002032200 [Echinococcus granulosus]